MDASASSKQSFNIFSALESKSQVPAPCVITGVWSSRAPATGAAKKNFGPSTTFTTREPPGALKVLLGSYLLINSSNVLGSSGKMFFHTSSSPAAPPGVPAGLTADPPDGVTGATAAGVLPLGPWILSNFLRIAFHSTLRMGSPKYFCRISWGITSLPSTFKRTRSSGGVTSGGTTSPASATGTNFGPLFHEGLPAFHSSSRCIRSSLELSLWQPKSVVAPITGQPSRTAAFSRAPSYAVEW